ncbi:hypothetical protein M427DRAFT_53892 [Gonapodya prolifera JEL478]|uniref:Cyclin-like domain-containing protein n=1 Tax=Gonapodya prolifera (strain JEL478) TaxID=1344416 RepID=A0A139AP66_GONPJ|nr:hypothetical protein M427DRAFT_53892 [Gonapodya prolifera JEL478]|eukprot:KXS18518.1 hypothetical protein M427DRAFT_53892 [Gonapodya prolifera JEL478]
MPPSVPHLAPVHPSLGGQTSTLPSHPDVPSEAANTWDGLAEYASDFMRELSKEEELTLPMPNFLDYQTDLTPPMRKTLLEWLIEVHYENGLSPEALPLAINLIDRYLSKRTIPRRDFQLLGICSLFIASKYCDLPNITLTVNAVIALCCGLYRRGDIAEMERRILHVVSFDLSYRSAPWVLAVVTGEQSREEDGSRWQYGSLAAGSTTGLRGRPPIVMFPQLHLTIAYFLADISLLYRRFIALRGAAVAVGCMIAATRIVEGWGMQKGGHMKSLELNHATTNQLEHLARGDEVVPHIASNLVDCAVALFRSVGPLEPGSDPRAQIPCILRKWSRVAVNAQVETGYRQIATVSVTLMDILAGFEEYCRAEEEKTRLMMAQYLTPTRTSPPRNRTGPGSQRVEYFPGAPPSPASGHYVDSQYSTAASTSTSTGEPSGRRGSMSLMGTMDMYSQEHPEGTYATVFAPMVDVMVENGVETQFDEPQPVIPVPIPPRSKFGQVDPENMLPTPPYDHNRAIPHDPYSMRPEMTGDPEVMWCGDTTEELDGGIGPAAVAVAVSLEPRFFPRREGIAARRIRSGHHPSTSENGAILHLVGTSRLMLNGNTAGVEAGLSGLALVDSRAIPILTPPLSPGMSLDGPSQYFTSNQ